MKKEKGSYAACEPKYIANKFLTDNEIEKLRVALMWLSFKKKEGE